MKLAIALLALVPFLAVGCAAVSSGVNQASPAPKSSHSNNIWLLLGGRSMTDTSDWSPTDQQIVGQISYAYTPADWPIGIEVSAAYSEDEDSGVKGENSEVAIGARKAWDISDGKLHPYVGIGLAFVKAQFSGFGLSDDDTSLAGYVHGGAYYDLGSNWQIGGDLRYLFGSSITLFGTDGDADYLQLGVFVGYGF